MTRLTDNVRCLGNQHFNHFVVGQDKAAIVECGVTGSVMNLEQQWPWLVPPPNIQYLIAMHAHFDHICGIPQLRRIFPEALVGASPKAQKVMEKIRILEGFFDQDRIMMDLLVEQGCPAEWFPIPQLEPMRVDLVLQDGDHVLLDHGLRLEMIAAPGHSPCSMAAYLPADHMMFISDAAGFQISATEIFPIFFQGYHLYLDSIQRLMGYPARILAIPHESIWTGSAVEDFYQRALAAAREAYDAIQRMLQAGSSHDYMADVLFDHYYHGNLQIYTPANIRICVNLLIQRVQECLA